MTGERSIRVAYLAPFLLFLAFLFVAEGVAKIGDGYSHWALAQPRYWVFPIQTIACGALLWAQRRRVQYRPFAGFGFAVLAGLIALGLWISPQALFGVAPRVDGFDPTFFGHGGWFYWTNLTFRIIRIGLVVPFVEEIFWRGFLLRYLVREDFDSVAFGTFTWRSFSITSVAFCLEHQFQDWPAAVLTGALYNLVAYRTRSLAACIFTHAVTNLALAAYILRTGQWGFW